MTKYISLTRVSTTKQGDSGLGLAAQRTAIHNYCAGKGDIIAEYEEVKSGAARCRPVLDEALAHAKAADAVLIVAKTDRLARSMLAWSSIVATGVKIALVDMGIDMGTAQGRMMANVLMSFAEFEREMIRERTKGAYAEAVSRDKDNTKLIGVRSRQARVSWEETYGERVMVAVESVYEIGERCGLVQVARALKREGILTPRGKPTWQPVQVDRMLKSMGIERRVG